MKQQLYKNIFQLPYPPDYATCKYYLDFLLKVIDYLAIPFIYVDSDKLAYSKLCEILWKNKGIYTKIILLMGGFHQLRVMQWLPYKRHFPKGYRKWCIDTKTIAGDSIDQVLKDTTTFEVQFCIEKDTAQSRSCSVC